jgi:hypothetical protein
MTAGTTKAAASLLVTTARGFHHDLDPRASQVLASRSQIQVLFL